MARKIARELTHQTICHTDLFATLADITRRTFHQTPQDSVSFLPAVFGKKINSTRHGIIHHSFSGHFAYRHEALETAPARGSGG